MDIKVLVTLFIFFFGGAGAVSITITNNCSYTVCPATSTNLGSPPLSIGSSGFCLPTGASQTLDAPPGWSGRMWARTGCAAGQSGMWTCQTGDCGTGSMYCGALPTPPVTYTDFVLGDAGSNSDAYQVSVAAGFNVPVSVKPLPAAGLRCEAASCPTNVNAICPRPLRLVGGDGGATIGCMSPCQALQDAVSCCEGKYRGANNCKPTKFSMFFGSVCPKAMSFAYENAYLYCRSGSDYLVTFCPNMYYE